MNAIPGDAFAGRTTGTTGTVSALEVTAMRASYDAYIGSIEAGHTQIIEDLHREHSEEITALKDQSDSDIKALKDELSRERNEGDERQQAAATHAKRKAQEECIEVIKRLKTQISDQGDEMKRSRDEAASASQENQTLQEKNEKLKTEHEAAIKKLKAKLAVGPNSWLQLRFRGKGRMKQRTYFHRYTATTREATKELMKEMGSAYAPEYQFRRGDAAGRVCGLNETLQQVSTWF